MTSTSADPVSVTAHYTVHCANETSLKSLESPFSLGPFDQTAGFVPIAVVFVYRKTSDVAPIQSERLQLALSILLDYYPHLTGRLQINPSDGIREVARFGTGAGFFVAQCREQLDTFSSPEHGRILMSSLPGAGNALLAPFDPSPDAVCRGPLLTVQHTRFACGGVALGVRLHHSICDGDGFFQLVSDLAEIYRGIHDSTSTPLLAHPPHIRPYMAEVRGGNVTPEERAAALDFKPTLFYSEPVGAATATLWVPPPDPVIGRFLRFSSTQLKALKARATDPSGSSWVSTFEALAAYLYQRVYKARLQLRVTDPTLPALSPPDFFTPVNLRSQLALPPRYFPNALFATSAPLPTDILAHGPLWQVARAVHDLLRGPSTTQTADIDGTLRWLALQPDLRAVRLSFRYGSGSFVISQWNKFDMYGGAVFDVPPVLVSPPFTPSSLLDGLAYTLPGGEVGVEGGDKGAIEVNMSLSAPLWDLMDQDGSSI
ncbi:transferase [Mycena crocata]|nr:transferase [Mycena crocata]